MVPQPPTDRSWTLSARWVFPADKAPIRDGMITVHSDRILSVGHRLGPAIDFDLGDAAIVPGLVNTHTHLDLTGFAGLCPPGNDFPAWLAEVIRLRFTLDESAMERDLEVGLNQSLRAGVTLLGDISGSGESWRAIEASPLRATVYPEVLGLTPARAEATWSRATEMLQAGAYAKRVRFGLSPHSPYSANRSLLEKSAATARPLCIHFLESREEFELLENRSGPMLQFLRSRGLDSPGMLATSIQDVADVADSAPSVLWVHGNYWTPDLRLPPRSTIVYCPRTHAAFGHPKHPVKAMIEAGLRVVLGTDSLASNPDLNIWAEARFLLALEPTFDRRLLLQMITADAADALGWGDRLGSLTAGKFANLVSLPILSRSGVREADPYELLWSLETPPAAVMVDGRWLPT